MQTFFYYVFELYGEKHYYYTTVSELDENEIIDWAENYGFLNKEDIQNCSNVSSVSVEEVNELEKELYKVWWKERQQRILKGEEVGNIPPHIGVQLN